MESELKKTSPCLKFNKCISLPPLQVPISAWANLPQPTPVCTQSPHRALEQGARACAAQRAVDAGWGCGRSLGTCTSAGLKPCFRGERAGQWPQAPLGCNSHPPWAPAVTQVALQPPPGLRDGACHTTCRDKLPAHPSCVDKALALCMDNERLCNSHPSLPGLWPQTIARSAGA